MGVAPPAVTPGLPSTLLARRPDIQSAEAQLVSANAQIGVARAAFFPALSFSAAGGFENSSFAQLLSLPQRFWSLGPSLAVTLFGLVLAAAVRRQLPLPVRGAGLGATVAGGGAAAGGGAGALPLGGRGPARGRVADPEGRF